MFNFGFNSHKQNKYIPYINYTWSNTLQVANKMYSKNIGNSGQDLQLFSGQGCWFNGIDQNIVLETVPPSTSSQIWTICFNVNTASTGKYIIRTIGDIVKVLWFNGGLTYYNGSTNIKLDTTNISRPGSYVVSSDGNNIYTYLNNVLISTVTQNSENLAFGTIRDIGGIITSVPTLYLGVIKDVYYFRKNITETERSNYFNQPNQFFMDSLEDNSCITAMPMCEKDGFVRNYKSYSEGSNLVGAYLFTDYGTFGTQGTITIDNGIYTQTVTTAGTSNTYPRSDFVTKSARYAGKIYVYEFDYEVLSGTCILQGFYNGFIFGTKTLTGKGRASVVSMGTVDRTSNNIYFDGRNLFSVKYWNFSVKELTSIYPITNYLATCRTKAQRLPYGLQTSGFKRDNLGRILSKSIFLEADGVGYGDTGWIPTADEDWSIELICDHNLLTTGTIGLLGTDGTSTNNRFRLYVYYHPGSNTRRPHIWIEDQYIAQSTSIDVPERYLITVTYDSSIKRYHYYLNSEYVGFKDIPNFLNSLPVKIFQYTTYQTWTTPLRLFVVYKKALTQKEATDNFNKYDKLGLLSESGLPPEPIVPDNALVDENGNYILDENNNFIIVE